MLISHCSWTFPSFSLCNRFCFLPLATFCKSQWTKCSNLVGGWTTHLKNMLVKLGIFPKDRDENSKNMLKHFEPPPRYTHTNLSRWEYPGMVVLGTSDILGDDHRMVARDHSSGLQEDVQVIIVGHHSHCCTTQHVAGTYQNLKGRARLNFRC